MALCHENSMYELLSSLYINTSDQATRKVALRTMAQICRVNPRCVRTTALQLVVK